MFYYSHQYCNDNTVGDDEANEKITFTNYTDLRNTSTYMFFRIAVLIILKV